MLPYPKMNNFIIAENSDLRFHDQSVKTSSNRTTECSKLLNFEFLVLTFKWSKKVLRVKVKPNPMRTEGVSVIFLA